MARLTTTELRALFEPVPARTITCVDQEYATVNRAWLRVTFWPWFRRTCRALNLTWTPASDCDDFARLAAALAQTCNSRRADVGSPTASALAFGEYGAILDRPGPHYFCAAVVEDNEVTYWEPQTGRELTPCADELATTFYVRF